MAEFLRSHSGVEAVIRRIGIRSTQLILVGETGEWRRWVVPSAEDARTLCRVLEIAEHEDWPEDLRRRINSYQRSPEDWRKAPYPERYGRGST